MSIWVEVWSPVKHMKVVPPVEYHCFLPLWGTRSLISWSDLQLLNLVLPAVPKMSAVCSEVFIPNYWNQQTFYYKESRMTFNNLFCLQWIQATYKWSFSYFLQKYTLEGNHSMTLLDLAIKIDLHTYASTAIIKWQLAFKVHPIVKLLNLNMQEKKARLVSSQAPLYHWLCSDRVLALSSWRRARNIRFCLGKSMLWIEVGIKLLSFKTQVRCRWWICCAIVVYCLPTVVLKSTICKKTKTQGNLLRRNLL